VVDAIVEQLEKLQNASAPLSLVTICGIVVATILEMAPKIFEKKGNDRSVFRCSDSWLCGWLHKTLNWSERKATRAGHKLPKDWEAQCEKSFMRLVYDIKEHDIPTVRGTPLDPSSLLFLTLFYFYSLFSVLLCYILTGSISTDCDCYGHSYVM
jgi:hypothetical protein